MKIAILSNPVIVGYPWELFPNTSFPNGIPTADFLAENNAKAVNMYKEHSRFTEKLQECEPYEEGDWVYTVRVVALTEEEISAWKFSAWSTIQLERNEKLAKCDWTQLPDVNIPNKAEWAAYRQALRDITTQDIDPRVDSVIWPTDPVTAETQQGETP